MRLVACPNCHTQYDVTNAPEKRFQCRCGEPVENRSFEGVEALVHRCAACGAQVGSEAESCSYCGSEIIRDTHALSLICPECFARNAEAARFCTGCGVAFAPELLPADQHELPCPCCGCLMPVRSVGGVGINECPECNGLWVPDDKFDLLVNRAIEVRRGRQNGEVAAATPRVKGGNPARQSVAYRKCPVCEGFMQRRNFRRSSGVITDRCNKHGTWLDADELEQIAGFITSGGRPGAEEFLEEESNLPSLGSVEAAMPALGSRGSQLLRARHKAESQSLVGSLVDALTELLD